MTAACKVDKGDKSNLSISTQRLYTYSIMNKLYFKMQNNLHTIVIDIHAYANKWRFALIALIST